MPTEVVEQAAPLGSTEYLLIALAAMAIAPFLFAMVTSFLKLVVVGSLIRTALGTQQIPPTIVITALAMVLTAHVMWPVAAESWDRYERGSGETWTRVADAAHGPMRAFLDEHATEQNKALFVELRDVLQSKYQGGDADNNPARRIAKEYPIIDDLTTLVPAFAVTELMEAFQIGFLIFVPFLIIDLVVSNLLMAVGMQYLQPTVISVPLKLLLFILIDGWQLIFQGVILGYA